LPYWSLATSEKVSDSTALIEVGPTIDQWDAWTISTPFTNTIKITLEEFRAADLQTLLNHFRRKLVHAVFRGVAKDMVDSAATVGRSTVLANMLNAPIAKLTVGDNIDAIEDLGDARTLSSNTSQELVI